MHPLELTLCLLALATGAASLCLAAYLSFKHRTPLLRSFAVFDAALFFIATSFALGSAADSLAWIAVGSSHAAAIGATVSALRVADSLAQAIGSVAVVAVTPFFTCGLFDRQPDPWYRRFSLGSASAMALLLGAYALTGGASGLGETVSVLLFANIGLAVLASIRWLRVPSPMKSIPSGSVRGFIVLTACFLPLFIADAFILGRPAASALDFLDNTSVPLYFIALNIGCALLAVRDLDHPPLLEEDRVSSYGRELYGLTGREADVLEYVLDGYSLKDLALVLGIAAKTAENHLQSVYRKTGVNNRIQLFQAFQNQRRST